MRIATWNLEGRWSDGHRKVLDTMACDVFLLTEVPLEIDLPGFDLHRSSALMGTAKHWSAVASRGGGVGLADPHPASAAVAVDGVVYCSSVLPWLQWSSRHGFDSWCNGTPAERMASTLAAVVEALRDYPDVVWGGDWNTPLSGSLSGFSRAGQRSVLDAVALLGLSVPTAELESAVPGCLAIDHVAVPGAVRKRSAQAVPVSRKLSDHWAYVVDADVRANLAQAGREELNASPAASAASAAPSSVVGT